MQEQAEDDNYDHGRRQRVMICGGPWLSWRMFIGPYSAAIQRELVSLSCHRSHLDLHVVELRLHELPKTSIGRVAAELSCDANISFYE